MKKILIIGGGAAGMMAAYNAKNANGDLEVVLLEKNAYLGAKVIISGGGRCNVTTGVLDLQEVLKNYPRGAKFLRTALYSFPPAAVIDFFECLGVPLKTEADLRVFPVSNNGKDFVAVLEKALIESGVEILLNAQVNQVSAIKSPELNQTKAQSEAEDSGKFLVLLKDGRKLEGDALILTTGGQAYRHTGSSGDGYAFAMALGHSITALGPSLNSLVLAEPWLGDLAGISFKKVGLNLKSQYKRSGPILFSHRGVTGPAVFALSALAAFEQFSKECPLKLQIDFFPDLSTEKLEQNLMDLFQQYGGKLVVNVLDMLLPKAVGEKIFLMALDSDLTRKSSNDFALVASKVSKVFRKKLVSIIKAFELTVIGRGSGDEFVTAGGVKLEEVNSKTMESKCFERLYLAGEILDIDGFTGGFNLQASWASGALAGTAAAKKLGPSK